MAPVFHLVLAGAIGVGVYGVSGSWQSGVATVASGVLPDLDHLLDYYNWFVRRRVHRLFYLFHGWEYLVLCLSAAALMSWHPVMIGVSLGYASHILGDYLVNYRNPAIYSITYRAMRRFLRWKIRRCHICNQYHSSLASPIQGVASASMIEVLRWLVPRSLGFPHKPGPSETPDADRCSN